VLAALQLVKTGQIIELGRVLEGFASEFEHTELQVGVEDDSALRQQGV
jgi:hypothetical protein